MKLLSVDGICKSFGGLAAVSNMSFEVEKGQIISIIGPNGAGKTTVFNLLTGFYSIDAGSIQLNGTEISNLPPFEYVEKGLTRTFQNLKLFPTMTVLENVLIGYQSCIKYARFDAILNTKKKKKEEQDAIEKSMEILKSISMEMYATEKCCNLPYGVQKQLEIARAMVSKPELLLLDEPAAGLNPQETEQLAKFIKGLPDKGYSVLLIEHDMSLVMTISDYIYVMDYGKKLLREFLRWFRKTSRLLRHISAREVRSMLLEVKGLNTFYGNLHVIWDIDIQVEEKEIVALIGSNGAGKSTLLKTIAASLPMSSGEIIYSGQHYAPSHSRKANMMVKQGITLCPEGRHIFPRMTVQENLKMGGYIRQKGELQSGYDRVYNLFPRLKERYDQMAGTLSGGEQQMLAIGRALMSNPRLLMLDEPSLGLSPLLTEKMFELILEIRNQGTTILLVEQNAVSALSIADRGYVLKVGHITHTGTGKELLESQNILASYLGA